jgi:hypothetical protein
LIVARGRRAGDAIEGEGMRREVAKGTAGKRGFGLMSIELVMEPDQIEPSGGFQKLNFPEREKHGSFAASFNSWKEVIRCRVGS